MSKYQFCSKCERVSIKRDKAKTIEHYEDQEYIGESKVDSRCPFEDCRSGVHLEDWDDFRDGDERLPEVPEQGASIMWFDEGPFYSEIVE